MDGLFSQDKMSFFSYGIELENLITEEENPQQEPPSHNMELLKKLKSILSTWTLRSLRSHVLPENQNGKSKNPFLLLCNKIDQTFYQPEHGSFSVLQRSLILISVGYNLALATCLPYYVASVIRLCCDVLALANKNCSHLLSLTLPNTILEFTTATGVALPSKKKEKNVTEITIRILESLCEKVASYGVNIKRVMINFDTKTQFEEVPFMITKEISYLFDSMAKCWPKLQILQNKHFTLCEHILTMMIEKNLINISLEHLMQSNDSIVSLTSQFDKVMNKYFSYSLLIEKTSFKAAALLYDKFSSLHRCNHLDFHKNIQAMWSLFLRVLYYSQYFYQTPKRAEYLKSRISLVKDFFQISTKLLTDFSEANDAIFNNHWYTFCLQNISQALKHCSTDGITFEIWTDLEYICKKYLSICRDATIEQYSTVYNFVQEIYQDIAIGILTAPLLRLPDRWDTRRLPIVLGLNDRIIFRGSDADFCYSETADTLSTDAMTDDSDSVISSSLPRFNRDNIGIDLHYLLDADYVDQKYETLFGTKIYLNEKYPVLEALSSVPSKRSLVLYAICILYETAQKHCANVNPNTIHGFVQTKISNRGDLYALSHTELKKILMENIIVPCEQLRSVNTLQDYYRVVEEINSDCGLTENDILAAVSEKDQLQFLSKLDSISDTVQHLFHMFATDNHWAKKFCDYLIHPQHANSILYQLESCGFEKFRILVYTMLGIYINILQNNELKNFTPLFKNQFIQFLTKITSDYYQTTALKAIFIKMTELNFSKNMPNDVIREALNFCTDLATVLGNHHSLYDSILSNSLYEFKQYLVHGNSWKTLPFSSTFFLSCPLGFASPRFTATFSQNLDLVGDYLSVSIDNNFYDPFVLALIRSKILRLVFEHLVSNANEISSHLSSRLFEYVNIEFLTQNFITMKQYWETRMESIDNSLTAAAFEYYRTANIGNLFELSNAMSFIFAREMCYRLCRSGEMVSRSHLRKSMFTLNYPNVDEIMYSICMNFNNKQDLENFLIEDLSNELCAILSNSDNQLFCVRECLWKINVIGEIIRNNYALVDDTCYENLFLITLKVLASNVAMPPEVLVMICKFLICYHPDQKKYMRIISTGETDLQIIVEQLDIYKNVSSSLYRFCVDLLHFLYSMYLSSDLKDSEILNTVDLDNPTIQTSLIPRYMSIASTFIRSLTHKLSNKHTFRMCKDVEETLRKFLNSKPMMTLVRNANFSLCHFSQSNSNIFVIPTIKKLMKNETKLEIIQKEINYLQIRSQECIPTANRSLFITKVLNASPNDRPRFEYLPNQPKLWSVLNYMNLHSSSSLLCLSTSMDYRHFFPIFNDPSSEVNNVHENLLLLQDACREINQILPTCVDDLSKRNVYYVAGYLVGVSILTKYILGPLNLDRNVLQLFLNDISLDNLDSQHANIEQLQALYNYFNAGIRMVLSDEITNMLKILTLEEFLSLLGDEQTIEKRISSMLRHVERDSDISQEECTNFVFKLLKPTLRQDTMLVNYFSGMFIHGKAALVTLTVIPSKYAQIQINPAKRVIEIPVRSTTEDLRALLRKQPHIYFLDQ